MRKLVSALVLLGWFTGPVLAQDFLISPDNPKGVKLQRREGPSIASDPIRGPSIASDPIRGPSIASDPINSWENLRQLRVWKKIRLVDANSNKFKGRLVKVSENALTLRAKTNGRTEILTFPRHEIRTVSIRNSKAKLILLLALAGGLEGATLATDTQGDGNFCPPDDRRPSGTEVAIGAGIGAAMSIAAALSDSSEEIVYFQDSSTLERLTAEAKVSPWRPAAAPSAFLPVSSEVQRQLKRERAGRNVISIQLDRPVEIPGTALNPGRYRLVFLRRHGSAGDLYFFPGKQVRTRRVMAVVPVRMASQAEAEDAPRVAYVDKGGTTRISKIRASGKVMRFQPPARMGENPQSDPERHILTAVEPRSGKPGDTATATGENLANSSVVAVFLSDAQSDYKVTVLEQTPEKIVFKVPSMKPASYNVSLQVRNNIYIHPVRFKIE